MSLKAEEKLPSQRRALIVGIVAIVVVTVIIVIVVVAVFVVVAMKRPLPLLLPFGDAHGDEFVLDVNRLFDHHPGNVENLDDSVSSSHDHEVGHQQDAHHGAGPNLRARRGGGRRRDGEDLKEEEEDIFFSGHLWSEIPIKVDTRADPI